MRFTASEENSLQARETSALLVKEITALLKNSAALFDYNDLDFTLIMDDSLPDKYSSLWLAYTIVRANYIIDHNELYKIPLGPVTPLFEEEAFSRQHLVTIYNELKESDKSLSYDYLEQLSLVDSAGFMKEYVWVFLKQSAWTQPQGLRLNEFNSWTQENLKDHAPQTYGGILAVKKQQED